MTSINANTTASTNDPMKMYNYNNFLDTMLTSMVYKNISSDDKQSTFQSIKYMFLVSLVPEVKRILTEIITFLIKKVPELIYELPKYISFDIFKNYLHNFIMFMRLIINRIYI